MNVLKIAGQVIGHIEVVELDGREYEIAPGPDNEIAVRSHATGRCMVLRWPTFVELARNAGIDRMEGPTTVGECEHCGVVDTHLVHGLCASCEAKYARFAGRAEYDTDAIGAEATVEHALPALQEGTRRYG